MWMKMMVDAAHDLLLEVLNKEAVAVDFTMGNGFDTVFLAKHAKHVYAFDKQEMALKATKQRLLDNRLDNVTLILDGHENAARYLPFFAAGIFNLGYLPGADHHLTTQTETTLCALKTALDLLKAGGRLVLVVYPGHEEGKRESEALQKFVAALSPHDYQAASFKMENKKLSPYVLFIDKVA